MREYIKKSENQSRTLGNNPKASNQARVSDILQASDTSGRKTSPKAVTKLGNTIQRILLIDGATYTDDNGDAGLKTLIDDSRVWKFRTLNEAKSVGKLVKTMEKLYQLKMIWNMTVQNQY